VLFTTHSVEDVKHADRVIVIGSGGRLAATGTPDEVLARFGVETFADLYGRLADHGTDVPTLDTASNAATVTVPTRVPVRRAGRNHLPSALRQWWVLLRRSAEILGRNRLTLAILLGSPAAVIAMFAVLFQAGGVDPETGSTAAAVQVAYWLSFAGFFFGLTYGLLQVCGEVAVLRREAHAGMRTSAYLASKLALLTPVLLAVNAVMLVVLRLLDRVPEMSARTVAGLYLTMGLNSLAALCLGLLASAAVRTTAQAALALPMLCFPAVLFSGAMVPVPVMARAGRVIAAAMPDRWAFEAIARHLDVGALTPAESPYAGLGASALGTYWMLLLCFTGLLGIGATVAVRRRASAAAR
jgi:ABC-2 type transporter